MSYEVERGWGWVSMGQKNRRNELGEAKFTIYKMCTKISLSEEGQTLQISAVKGFQLKMYQIYIPYREQII